MPAIARSVRRIFAGQSADNRAIRAPARDYAGRSVRGESRARPGLRAREGRGGRESCRVMSIGSIARDDISSSHMVVMSGQVGTRGHEPPAGGETARGELAVTAARWQRRPNGPGLRTRTQRGRRPGTSASYNVVYMQRARRRRIVRRTPAHAGPLGPPDRLPAPKRRTCDACAVRMPAVTFTLTSVEPYVTLAFDKLSIQDYCALLTALAARPAIGPGRAVIGRSPVTSPAWPA